MYDSSLLSNLLINYLALCEQTSSPPNKSLIRFLQKLNESSAQPLKIIFKGNDKYNFTSRLTDGDLLLLAECLSEISEFIHTIDFSYNLLTDDSIQNFAKVLNQCPNLVELSLEGNEIGILGAQAISDSLQSNTNLEILNLNSNQIKTDGAQKMVEFLFTNKSLKHLDIGNNEIDHDGIIGITSVLNWNNNILVSLNLDNAVYTSIGQETAIHLAKMLQSNKTLEKISLKKHAFNCEAIYIMTEHLLENTKLRVLDLTANRISFKGCEALAKYLTGEFCALESLILTSNRLGHYGAKAIAHALSKNKTLVHLDMVKCDIDDNGLRMIAESLFENEVICSLKLFYNHFDQMSLRVFHELKGKERNSDWFWDFITYIIDEKYQMAYYETKIPYDVNV